MKNIHWTKINNIPATRGVKKWSILADRRLAGVALRENLTNLPHGGNEARKRGNPLWLWNPWQKSQGVQKEEYRLPEKKDKFLQNFEKESVPYNKQMVKLSNKIDKQYLSMCEASGKTPKEVSMVQGKSSKQKIFAFVK